MNRLMRWVLGGLFDRRHFPPVEGGVRAMRPWLKAIWFQKILRFNARCPWPLSPTSRVSDYDRIDFPPGEIHNFQSPGLYIQNFSAGITLGSGTFIGPNVGLITANHDPMDPSRHLPGSDIVIADKCWIGMGCVILPGVTLGEGTVVAAGSVVTKSFPDGSCVLAGSPARVVKRFSASSA